MRVGEWVVIDGDGLDRLIGVLGDLGYETLGPVVRDGAIVPGAVRGIGDLPAGYRDAQGPGRYEVVHGGGDALFAWAVGPGSWKAEFFPPVQEQWRMPVGGEPSAPEAGTPRQRAVVGARPCEIAALSVLDRVLAGGAVPDPAYTRRRQGTFVMAAECGAPASTCFCTSMGTGPSAESGFDLALAELGAGDEHRFLVRVGTERGAQVLAQVPGREATEADRTARVQMLDGAARAITRRMPAESVAALLTRNIEHPRWAAVAERCLACGNCTLVCPTCFCSDVRDTSTLSGEVRRERSWSSCFDLDHSYLNGGPVRPSTASRYRQWLTHKLSTWWDQFATSGCVGCGRCITWCPVGIDLTEEVEAIARHDGDSAAATAGSPS
jgi:sulfhydrogenase subunit beta (sulfur reductase)